MRFRYLSSVLYDILLYDDKHKHTSFTYEMKGCLSFEGEERTVAIEDASLKRVS